MLSTDLCELDKVPANIEELNLRAGLLRSGLSRPVAAVDRRRRWLDVAAKLLKDEVTVLEHFFPCPDAFALVRYALPPDVHC